ncbi:MAG: hypothetical protein U1D25_12360 [Hydrogenophaga sp.]|uniref:hypothetical protein n=1 Tax=Hydrogenophaga sp. TaxID=1904254 RepID=UPI002766E9A3|nr:hypothetical protein [Hydrogenophaga sp.]MDP2418085.1 hypothetical protein [Hydrogenophaga sp.]MDZ4188884.1 hypothetical protein [Hydrogenophaga sp.]
MSERRIALVAEGPTDFEVIQAALKAIVPVRFTLTLLQPEPTQPAMGSGWGGVLKWCDAAGARHAGTLDTDPTLEGVDLLVIHLDVDVAQAQYADCGLQVPAQAGAKGWATLPCHMPCPPVADTCARLETVFFSWLSPAQAGPKTVLCLPAQSSGTWLAAATLPAGHVLLGGAECNVAVESRLAQLPLAHRIRKVPREYRSQAGQVTANWARVKSFCSQADAFEQAVKAAL